LKAVGFEPPQPLSKRHHPALPYDRMPAFMADLCGREAVAARALEFLILTNVRTDAVLKATWGRIQPRSGGVDGAAADASVDIVIVEFARAH
jgi:hypothetical protein